MFVGMGSKTVCRTKERDAWGTERIWNVEKLSLKAVQ